MLKTARNIGVKISSTGIYVLSAVRFNSFRSNVSKFSVMNRMIVIYVEVYQYQPRPDEPRRSREDRSLTMYKEKTQMPNGEGRRSSARSQRSGACTSDYSPVGDMPLYRGRGVPFGMAETQEKNYNKQSPLSSLLGGETGRRLCDGTLREDRNMYQRGMDGGRYPSCNLLNRRDRHADDPKNECGYDDGCESNMSERYGMAKNEMNGTGGCGCKNDCTTDRCGGWGLSSHPLAMVYSPCQAWRDAYTPDVALCRGTLFSELDLPFEGKMSKRGCL